MKVVDNLSGKRIVSHSRSRSLFLSYAHLRFLLFRTLFRLLHLPLVHCDNTPISLKTRSRKDGEWKRSVMGRRQKVLEEGGD